MVLKDKLLFGESIAYYALYQRLKIYTDKAQTIAEQIKQLPNGAELTRFWNQSDYYHTIFQSTGETLDTNPTPLVSIFSKVHIRTASSEKKYYYPNQWNEAVYLPLLSERPSANDLTQYWLEVASAFKEFLRVAPEDTEVRLSQFLDWSDTWLSSIAVNKDLETIPLANHIRLMVAIAVASDEKGSFKLVLGDVSGIQSYLFDIAHIGAGKVAKRLRARSFHLGLIAEVYAHQLLQMGNMPMTNLLLSAGGLFYAVLPSDVSIDDWKKHVNQILYKQFHGAIALHSASSDISLEEMNKDFPGILEKLYENIRASKGRTFENILIEKDGWDEAAFVHEIGHAKEMCRSCRKFPMIINHSEGFCMYCNQDEILGRKLPKTKYLLFKKGRGDINFGDYGVQLLERVDNQDGYLLQVWNDAEITNPALPIQRKWIANHVPIGTPENMRLNEKLENNDLEPITKGSPLNFGHLAFMGKGKDKIGYLKADVDNLGMLFTIGLVQENEQEKKHTFSHILTLSRLLERFFSGGLNQWLEEKFRLTYTVFSGGDDLFLIGPWEEIIKIAIYIRSQFIKFVAGNPEITLSAGILFTKPKYPVTTAAHKAEMLLDQAKEERSVSRIERNVNRGRNQVCVSGTLLEWEDFKRIESHAVKLAKWWKDEKLTSAFIYRLNDFSNMYLEYRKGKIENLKFVPLFHYFVQRNLIETKVLKPFKKEDKEVLVYIQQLQKIDSNDSHAKFSWTYMNVIVQISSLYKP